MRRLLSIGGLSALVLPIALLACVPKVHPDPVGTGGSGGTAAVGPTTTTGTGTGTSTGVGGSGGAGPTGSCSKAGQAFTIMGDTELDGAPKLGDKIYLVPDAGTNKQAMVHVVIEDTGMNRVLVRSVRDDTTTPLGNFSQHGAVGVPSFRPVGAKITPGQLHIRGTNGNYASQLSFVLDPDKGVGVDGVIQDLPTPVECLQGGHPGKIAYALGSSPPQYLVTCVEDSPGIQARLFVGDGTSAPVELLAKDPASPEMRPELYTYENGTHLVIFGGDKGGSFFSQGTDPSLLGLLQPLKLTPTPATLEGVFATVPLLANSGVTLITAFFDTTVGKGQFLAGPVLAKDYSSLAKIPPGNIAPIQDIALLADVAPIFFPTWDATGIFGGGASSDSASARFYWFTRDGKPLVFGQTIYTSPGPAILAANAAPLGDINKLVVWTEWDAGATPPKYTVKGQRLICQIKS